MKHRVKMMLELHTGKDDAISVANIAHNLHRGRDTGLTNPGIRKVIRKVIRDLIADGTPIASCGNGYYMIENQDELIAYTGSLHSRVYAIQGRILDVIAAYYKDRS